MSMMDGFGLAESAILMLVTIGKFIYGNLIKQIDGIKEDAQKREDKLEARLEKMDEKYRDITRDLYGKQESNR